MTRLTDREIEEIARRVAADISKGGASPAPAVRPADDFDTITCLEGAAATGKP